MLLVEGQPSSVTLVAAVLRERAPDTRVVHGPAAFAQLPPGSSALVLVSLADASTLNLDRSLLAARQLSVVLFVDREQSLEFRNGARDLVDWMRARIEIPDAPPWWLGARLDLLLSQRAAGHNTPIGWVGPWLDQTLAERKLEAQTVSANADFAAFVGVARAPLVRVTGLRNGALRWRARLCLAELVEDNPVILEGDPSGVHSEELPTELVLARLAGVGLGARVGALAVVVAGRQSWLNEAESWARRAAADAWAGEVEPIDASLGPVPELDSPHLVVDANWLMMRAVLAGPPAPTDAAVSVSISGDPTVSLADLAWKACNAGFYEDAARIAARIPAGESVVPGVIGPMIRLRRRWLEDGADAVEPELAALSRDQGRTPEARVWVLDVWASWLLAEGRVDDAEVCWNEANALDVDVNTRSNRVLLQTRARVGVNDPEELPARVSEEITRIERALGASPSGPGAVELELSLVPLLLSVGRVAEAEDRANRLSTQLDGPGAPDMLKRLPRVRFFARVLLDDLEGAAKILAEVQPGGLPPLVYVVNRLQGEHRRERALRVCEELLLPHAHQSGAEADLLAAHEATAAVLVALTRPAEAAEHLLAARDICVTDPARATNLALSAADLLIQAGRAGDAEHVLESLDQSGLHADQQIRLWRLQEEALIRRGAWSDALEVERQRVRPLMSAGQGWLEHLLRVVDLARGAGELELAWFTLLNAANRYAATLSDDASVQVRLSALELLLDAGDRDEARALLADPLPDSVRPELRARWEALHTRAG